MTTIEKNEAFELAYRFITETQENIFLTGKAGTGKTTFLKYLKEHSTKNIIVAAPSGVAAINAGGVTLHSLLQLPFHPFVPTAAARQSLLSGVRYNKQRLDLLRKMDVLVIDEVSMVRCDVLDAIDTLLRSVRRLHNIPFGGVQLLFIGDLFQLPPVAQTEEWNILKEYYATPFFFDSAAIKEQMPLLVELTKIYRQKEENFISLLNKVRNNNLSADDLAVLNNRFIPGFTPTAEEKYITLTTHNTQANRINSTALQQLNSQAFIYAANISGDFPEKSYPAAKEMILKEGAQVMFLKNDSAGKRYFNGKIGTVKKLETDSIIVTADGQDITVQKELWENNRYALNRATGQLVQESLGTFEQFPLRLAWAITIHKSQGLTFDKVMIDAGQAFTGGQVYVALSRCTSIEGIVLLSKIPAAAIYNSEPIIKGQELLAPKGSLAERFSQARKLFTELLLEEVFSFSKTANALQQLQQQITKHKHDLPEDAATWSAISITACNENRAVSAKFLSLAVEQLKQEPVIENNTALQKRMQDAAVYFSDRAEQLKTIIDTHPLVTESKTVATEINEQLQLAAAEIFTVQYLLSGCKKEFAVTSFLKHKLNLQLPKFKISCYAADQKTAAPAAGSIPHTSLYNQLKKWRDDICNEQHMPVYMVASSNSLKELCLHLPVTKEQLLQISGFGKSKTDKFGDDILSIIVNYCDENHIDTSGFETQQKEKRSAKSAEKNSPTAMLTLQYFKEGKTVQEIAVLRKLTAGTIEGHLTDAVKQGLLPITDLISSEKLAIIEPVVKQNPGSTLSELRAILGEEYTYNEIRAVVNHVSLTK